VALMMITTILTIVEELVDTDEEDNSHDAPRENANKDNKNASATVAAGNQKQASGSISAADDDNNSTERSKEENKNHALSTCNYLSKQTNDKVYHKTYGK